VEPDASACRAARRTAAAAMPLVTPNGMNYRHDDSSLEIVH